MLTAAKGIIRGNIVIIEDDIREYDGAEVVVTILNYPKKSKGYSDLENNSIRASKIDNTIQALIGAVPYTNMTLSELREERLQRYEDFD